MAGSMAENLAGKSVASMENRWVDSTADQMAEPKDCHSAETMVVLWAASTALHSVDLRVFPWAGTWVDATADSRAESMALP